MEKRSHCFSALLTRIAFSRLNNASIAEQRARAGLLLFLLVSFASETALAARKYVPRRKTYSPVISFNLDATDVQNRSFRLAARNNREDELRELISKGADLNSRSDRGFTALSYAAQYCRPKIARVLLRAGADPTIKDSKGRTPLMFASRAACHSVVRVLLRHPKVRPHRQDKRGRSALTYAKESASLSVEGPELEVIRLLKARRTE